MDKRSLLCLQYFVTVFATWQYRRKIREVGLLYVSIACIAIIVRICNSFLYLIITKVTDAIYFNS